jgi:hypothetical protein
MSLGLSDQRKGNRPMSDVKLEPGWLARDVTQATERTSTWNVQKAKSPEGDRANRPPPEAQNTIGQGPKD